MFIRFFLVDKMRHERKTKGSFFELNCNDILTILCAAAVPIALGIYTAITYQQEQDQQQKMQELSLNQATEARRDKIYDTFLKNVYNLDKHGYLHPNQTPWAFANAYYRAAHRQLDANRKGDVLQFLKERQLIGRNNCTNTCGYKVDDDIIRLSELSFDHMNLSSQTGTLNRLDLTCVSFDQVSMNNVTFVFADLTGASFDKSRLIDVNFGNSSLVCASFNGTQFENVDFGVSDLTGAKFHGYDTSKLNLNEKQRAQLANSNEVPSTTSGNSCANYTFKSSSFCFLSVPVLLKGVQLNFDPLSLSHEWSNCYKASYAANMTSTDLSIILSTCNGNRLLLGCRPANESRLIVAAMGYRSDVLYNCSSSKTCTKQANGVGWYFSDSYSWGFAKGGDTVSRNACDIGSKNPAYRLCWHTLGKRGDRCGTTTGINSTDHWEKLIYHAN